MPLGEIAGRRATVGRFAMRNVRRNRHADAGKRIAYLHVSFFTRMRIIIRHFRGVSAMQLPCVCRRAVRGYEMREASRSWISSRGRAGSAR